MAIWWRALVLGAIAVGGPAYAQAGPGGAQAGPGGPGQPERAGGGMMGMFRMADANGDGVVTRAEYQATVDQRFARMDRNGDGALSPDEMPMRGGMRPMGGGMPPAPAGSAPAGDAGSPPPPPPGGMAPMGPMTRDQFRAAAMRRFEMMDANHDGKIDTAEMQAMAGRMRGGEGGPPPPAGNP